MTYKGVVFSLIQDLRKGATTSVGFSLEWGFTKIFFTPVFLYQLSSFDQQFVRIKEN